MSGKLFICGTPIGNLEDITLRVLRILGECDVIYAEDTRHTIKLLNHFEIKKPLYSYHEHNKNIKGNEILSKLDAGEKIALVSDAGMPGISDPGHDIIKLCIENGYKLEIAPGVTAFTTALVGSGISTERFSFEGFLNRDKKDRKKQLEELMFDNRTLLFYESPHRIKATLKAMYDVLGNRKIVLARELTKKFEEYHRGDLKEIIDLVEAHEIKGEMVIVLEGSAEVKPKEETIFDSMNVEQHIIYLLDQGIDKKEAIKIVAKQRGIKKSDVYEIALGIE